MKDLHQQFGDYFLKYHFLLKKLRPGSQENIKQHEKLINMYLGSNRVEQDATAMVIAHAINQDDQAAVSVLNALVNYLFLLSKEFYAHKERIIKHGPKFINSCEEIISNLYDTISRCSKSITKQGISSQILHYPQISVDPLMEEIFFWLSVWHLNRPIKLP